MRLSPHYLKRYKDMAVLLMRYGEPGMRPRFGVPEEVSANGQADAHDLPKDLERLGPTFIKLGQLLSSRPDILPERFVRSLSRLQDKVKPFPFAEVETTVAAELRTPVSKAFCSFDPEPLAAASLGQVHLARLHDGRQVVV